VQPIRSVDESAPSGCERVSKVRTVEQIGDGVTDVDKLCRSEVALEHQLTVSCTVILDVLHAFLIDDIERRIDLITAGDMVVDVEEVCLQRVCPCRVLSLDDDDLLDFRLVAVEVTGELIVRYECRLQRSLVKSL
jgi:hypothetical protein